MLATWVTQSSQVMVRTIDVSATVAVLKRHATIAEKKPETDRAKPNAIYKSIQWTVVFPKAKGTLRMASMTASPC
jgi:hypothetical protein